MFDCITCKVEYVFEHVFRESSMCVSMCFERGVFRCYDDTNVRIDRVQLHHNMCLQSVGSNGNIEDEFACAFANCHASEFFSLRISTTRSVHLLSHPVR